MRISTTIAPGQGHLWDYALLIILSCLFSPCLLSIDLFLIFLLAKSPDKVTPCPPHTVSSILPKFPPPSLFFFLTPHSFALLLFPPSFSLLSLPLPPSPCSSYPIKDVVNIIRQTSSSPAPGPLPFSHNQACTLTIKGDIANKLPQWSGKTHTYAPAKKYTVG